MATNQHNMTEGKYGTTFKKIDSSPNVPSISEINRIPTLLGILYIHCSSLISLHNNENGWKASTFAYNSISFPTLIVICFKQFLSVSTLILDSCWNLSFSQRHRLPKTFFYFIIRQYKKFVCKSEIKAYKRQEKILVFKLRKVARWKGSSPVPSPLH